MGDRNERCTCEPVSEQERLAALYDLDLLDTPPEKEYDDLVRLASGLCGTPIGQFTLLDHDRTWFKSTLGIGGTELPREISFCNHTIQQSGLMLVEDTTSDPRFRESVFVTGEPHVRFYAGVTLQAPGGEPVGTLCVADTVPRTLTDEQRQGLSILASQFESRFELHAKSKSLERSLDENQRLVAALQSNNDLFLTFMNNAPFASYIKDADGTMIFYNEYLARRSGVDRQSWVGLKDYQIWPLEVAQAFRANDLAVIQSGQTIEVDEMSGPPGNPIYWKSFKFPCKSADGRMLLAGMSIDVTADIAREVELAKVLDEKTQLTEQLKASQHFLYSFLDLSPTISFIKDDAGRYLFYNKAFAAFCGIDQSEWLHRSDSELFPKPIAETFLANDRLVLETGQVTDAFESAIDSEGNVHRFRSIKFTYKDFDGSILLAGMAIDVTADSRREEELALSNTRLELLAATDPLTGLSNRRVFEERAPVEFAVARRKMRPLSILVMDIDNFKRRNDLQGHAAGDEALRMFSDVLRACTRSGDLAARIGGEEFAYLLPETDSAGAHALGGRIQAALREAQLRDLYPLTHNNPMELTVSIGVATIDRTTPTWERLLCRADDAMYEAKRTGKNRIVVHDRLLADLLERSRRTFATTSAASTATPGSVVAAPSPPQGSSPRAAQ
jgi:diguanylate cyclase (GGDEF)-like protein/PAS domain S-box-containing protein